MNLLGDDLKKVLGAGFAAVYGDGVLHPQTKDTAPSGGDITITPGTDVPVKCQVGECTEKQMQEEGYDAKDVGIRVLQDGIATAPTFDDEITADDGLRYEIGPTIRQDSARSYWLLRGRKID